jgi:hypothetical protein
MEPFTRSNNFRGLRTILFYLFSFLLMTAVLLPPAVAFEDNSRVSTSEVEKITDPVELPLVQQDNCKRLVAARGPLNDQCLRVSKILAVMSAEPRATAWANATETVLQKWIGSLAPDGFTFRNVECRLSWCLVEAGSTIGAGDRRGHDVILESAETDKVKIFQAENLFVRDPDDASAWDVVILFKRYCTSPSEIFDGHGGLASDFYTLGQHC